MAGGWTMRASPRIWGTCTRPGRAPATVTLAVAAVRRAARDAGVEPPAGPLTGQAIEGFRRSAAADAPARRGQSPCLGPRRLPRQRGELRQRYREGQENHLDALGVVVNMIVLWNTIYMQAALDLHRAVATRCVQKTRRDCHRSATSTSTCWDATRSPYLNRSLGASSGRSETPLTAVANRTFRSIAPQTPWWSATPPRSLPATAPSAGEARLGALRPGRGATGGWLLQRRGDTGWLSPAE